MRFGPGSAVLAVILSLGTSPALAVVCQNTSMSLDEVVDVINAAPGCGRAMKIFEDCSLGTSGDIRMGAAAENKCEGDFLGKLKAPQKQAYQRELNVCDRKYWNESGTMYRSFTASCRAQISQRYSRGALKAASPSRAR
jgi:hypothetical protein